MNNRHTLRLVGIAAVLVLATNASSTIIWAAGGRYGALEVALTYPSPPGSGAPRTLDTYRGAASLR